MLRGGGWCPNAEGETVPNPQTEPAKASPYCCGACRALCANLCKPVQTSANLFVAFLKALLLAIACGSSALWARAGVCCRRIGGPGAKPCPKSLLGSCVGRGAPGAPSPVGPQVGGECEEAGHHVQAELRWGWGVAWRRPRAPARARTSPARSSCLGAERTCMMVKSTCNNINVLKTYARALENIIILLLSSKLKIQNMFFLSFQNVNFDRNPD